MNIPQTSFLPVSALTQHQKMLFQLFLIAVGLFLLKTLFNSRSFRNLPPGPSPIFPIVGNLLQLAKYKHKQSYETLNRMVLDYGPLIYAKFGQLDQVIIQDLALAKEVLSSELWVDRPFDELIGDRSFGKPLGIIFSSGEIWKEMRRFTTRSIRDFGFGKNQSMEVAIDEEISLMLESSDRAAEMGQDLCIRQFFSVSILNILWGMVAGVKFSHDDARLLDLLRLLDETSRSTPVEASLSTAFPFLYQFEKRTEKFVKRSRMHSSVQQLFKDILKERRQSGSYKGEAKDFIDVFIQQMDEQKKNPSSSDLYTEEQFIIVLYDLFTAGSETTSNTLEFAILYMALYPELQERVQRELDSQSPNRKPTLGDRGNLPFTEATLLEIQRLASVVPILIRNCTENTSLRGFNIPKGSLAGINLYNIHHSAQTWKDPEVCNPLRFLDQNGKVCNAGNILPFGLGKRVCLGESLARASLFSYFATFLSRYSFSYSTNYDKPSVTPVNGFTLSPQKFYIQIKKR